MQIDLHLKAQELLEALANSIQDREKNSANPFCFNIAEVRVAQEFLSLLMLELRRI